MTEPTASENGSKATFLTLALSGGGARAIAFHLGCMRALHDRRLLERVRVISTVSGGSVIGACYAYWAIDFAEFDRRIVRLLERGLQRSILVSALFSVEMPRIVLTLMVSGTPTLLLSTLHSVARLIRLMTGIPMASVEDWLSRICGALPIWGSLTTAFERALRRKVFGTTTLPDVHRPDLEVVINTCDLRTGTAFRFGSRASGGWRYGTIKDNDIQVAKAVAASAAYPLLLPPLVETFDFLRRSEPNRDTVILTDGGVFENLGVTVLEPGRDAQVSVNTYPTTHIISLNAGAGQIDGHAKPIWWGPRLIQTFQTVHRKVQDATYARLHRQVEHGDLDGFVMVYLGQDDNRLPVIPPDLIRRDAVRHYPTDFAPMTPGSIALLAGRGEQITHILVDRYLASL